jgi:predicted alpha/beta hydrolase
LRGWLYRPGSVPKAAIVLHSATGVPQGLYKGFAEWLSQQGYACLTYDCRDFGASQSGHCLTSPATMADWGLRDHPVAQVTLERLVPNVPLWVIGHSFGGLMLSFHKWAGRIARVITVASGPAHVRDHPLGYKPTAAAFWFGPGLWASKLMGYLLDRILGLPFDLPKRVYLQWRRWCTTDGFHLSDVGSTIPHPDWSAVTAPVKLVAVADDPMVPPAAVWRLMQAYPEASKRQLTLHPSAFGLKKIGHLHTFAREKPVLWPSLIA